MTDSGLPGESGPGFDPDNRSGHMRPLQALQRREIAGSGKCRRNNR